MAEMLKEIKFPLLGPNWSTPTPYCLYKKYLASHDGQSIIMTYSQWKEQEELKFRAVEAKLEAR